jgi:DNA-binding CsgD family transcriptional regulator
MQRRVSAPDSVRAASLIDLAYQAALDPSRWVAFLDRFADCVGGTATQFLRHDLRHSAGNIDTSVRLDLEARRQYDQHFAAMDPWIAAAASQNVLRPGVVCISHELLPHADLSRTAYYADFARRFDLTRSLAAVVTSSPSAICAFSTMRGERDAPFGRLEVQWFSLLLPHLRRASEMHARLEGADLYRSPSMAVLDAVRTAVVVLASTGKILFENTAATRLLAAEEGLCRRNGHLAAASPQDDALLGTAIRSLLAPRDPSRPGIRAVPIGRRRTPRPLHLVLVPVERAELPFIPANASPMIAFITDPACADGVEEAVLRRLFDLTPAEARITAAFAAGRTLAEIATLQATSVETVRWHFKRVLGKTGARSQADLMRVLAELAP